MRLRRSLGALVAASMVGDPDVLDYADAVVANGGTVSTARYPILTAFVGAEKASGAWDLTDDYWALWGESAAQALISLKQRRLATATAAPTFTTDRGYAFNGSTQYLDTGFIPGTHAVAMSTDNARIAIYERTNVNSIAYSIGASSSTNRNFRIMPRNSASALAPANSATATYTLPASNSQGYTVGSRSSAAAAGNIGYKNGVAMTRSGDPAGYGASLPIVSVYIGGDNTAGSLGLPRAASVGFAAVGASLSAAQELAQYNAVQAFATAVGANV